MERQVLSYEELRALPAREAVSAIHCVTGWSPGSRCTFRASPRRSSYHVASLTSRPASSSCTPKRGFTTNLLAEDLLQPESLLAFGERGQDLSPEHG